MNKNRTRRGSALLLLSLALMAAALYFSFRPALPKGAGLSSAVTAQSPVQQNPEEKPELSTPSAPDLSGQEELPAAEQGEKAAAPDSKGLENGSIPEEAISSQNQSPAPADSAPAPSAPDSEPTVADPPEEPDASADPPSSEPAASCTISISCAVLSENPELCSSEKRELIPEDGWILAPVSVSFEQDESVFDLLLRVCKDRGILLEFENTPLYGSAYIEGIGNLYEFDAGSQSGWMYEVNGWYPNTGCSGYFLQDGDVVCWRYTCNRGNDIGGGQPAE